MRMACCHCSRPAPEAHSCLHQRHTSRVRTRSTLAPARNHWHVVLLGCWWEENWVTVAMKCNLLRQKESKQGCVCASARATQHYCNMSTRGHDTRINNKGREGESGTCWREGTWVTVAMKCDCWIAKKVSMSQLQGILDYKELRGRKGANAENNPGPLTLMQNRSEHGINVQSSPVQSSLHRKSM
jgi:hypothetical protein